MFVLRSARRPAATRRLRLKSKFIYQVVALVDNVLARARRRPRTQQAKLIQLPSQRGSERDELIMGAQPTKPEREEADELQPEGTLPGQQPAMENANVESTQGDAPSKYYKLLGVPLPTPALMRDDYGIQWLHFGADIMGEDRITEQLKAAYTQIGTMAAVMIIFSTNMLLARTKLDIRSDIGARKQVMNFYTLAWILADVSFINCALFCVMLKLAMNECPDEVCAVRFADRFGGLSMAPIFMLLIACMCVIVGMGLYIYVTLGAAFQLVTMVIFGFVAIPFFVVWYHKLVDALYVSIETRRRRTSASERRDRELKRANSAKRKAKVKLDLEPAAISKAWTEYLKTDGSVEPEEFLDYLSTQNDALELTWATDRVARSLVELYCQKQAREIFES